MTDPGTCERCDATVSPTLASFADGCPYCSGQVQFAATDGGNEKLTHESNDSETWGNGGDDA